MPTVEEKIEKVKSNVMDYLKTTGWSTVETISEHCNIDTNLCVKILVLLKNRGKIRVYKPNFVHYKCSFERLQPSKG